MTALAGIDLDRENEAVAEAEVLAIVAQAIDRYIAARHKRVAAFVDAISVRCGYTARRSASTWCAPRPMSS